MAADMTAFLASTRITIQRGVAAADSWGDERPASTVIATGVPAAITEGVGLIGRTDQRTYQPADGRGGVVEDFTVRLRPGVDVTEDDRLVDERTGAVYQALAIFNSHPIVGLPDIRVFAIRTGAASQPVNG